MTSKPALFLLILAGLVWQFSDSPTVATATTTPAETGSVPEIDYGGAPPVDGNGVMPTIDGMADVSAGSPSAFTDVTKTQTDVSPKAVGAIPPASTEPLPDIAKHVFEISGHDGISGCAVSIAPDKLVSVHHVARYARTRVNVNGKWIETHVQHPPGADDIFKDGAYLNVPGGSFPAMKIRAPYYYEPVTIYGLTTKSYQRGMVTGYRTVSLVPDAGGIKNGDSGGAIVGDDGCLIGLISGVDTPPYRGIPQNDRIVTFTRMDYLGEYLPQDMQATKTEEQEIPKPVGSVDPSSAGVSVNKNQAWQTSTRYAYNHRWRSKPRLFQW